MKKTFFFICEWLSTGISFWIRNEGLYSLPLSVGTPSDPNIWRPFACCHSLYEFICAYIFRGLDTLESFMSLWLSESFHLLFLRVSWVLRGKELMEIHLGLSIQGVLLCIHYCPGVTLCMCSISCRRRFFWWWLSSLWWLSKTLIYEYSRTFCSTILLLCSLAKQWYFPLVPGLATQRLGKGSISWSGP